MQQAAPANRRPAASLGLMEGWAMGELRFCLAQYRDRSSTRQGSGCRFSSCLLSQPKTPDLSLRLCVALVVDLHAQHWGRGGLRFRCDLAHHRAEVTQQQLRGAELLSTQSALDTAEAHLLDA